VINRSIHIVNENANLDYRVIQLLIAHLSKSL
jgi:hypothetical protein